MKRLGSNFHARLQFTWNFDGIALASSYSRNGPVKSLRSFSTIFSSSTDDHSRSSIRSCLGIVPTLSQWVSANSLRAFPLFRSPIVLIVHFRRTINCSRSIVTNVKYQPSRNVLLANRIDFVPIALSIPTREFDVFSRTFINRTRSEIRLKDSRKFSTKHPQRILQFCDKDIENHEFYSKHLQ